MTFIYFRLTPAWCTWPIYTSCWPQLVMHDLYLLQVDPSLVYLTTYMLGKIFTDKIASHNACYKELVKNSYIEVSLKSKTKLYFWILLGRSRRHNFYDIKSVKNRIYQLSFKEKNAQINFAEKLQLKINSFQKEKPFIVIRKSFKG